MKAYLIQNGETLFEISRPVNRAVAIVDVWHQFYTAALANGQEPGMFTVNFDSDGEGGTVNLTTGGEHENFYIITEAE
jgi:hypothetical protein